MGNLIHSIKLVTDTCLELLFEFRVVTASEPETNVLPGEDSGDHVKPVAWHALGRLNR